MSFFFVFFSFSLPRRHRSPHLLVREVRGSQPTRSSSGECSPRLESLRSLKRRSAFGSTLIARRRQQSKFKVKDREEEDEQKEEEGNSRRRRAANQRTGRVCALRPPSFIRASLARCSTPTASSNKPSPPVTAKSAEVVAFHFEMQSTSVHRILNCCGHCIPAPDSQRSTIECAASLYSLAA